MTGFLEKNLAALNRHQPQIVQVILKTPRDENFQVSKSEDGGHVFLVKQGDQYTAISHLENAVDLAKQFVDQKIATDPGNRPFFFAGIRGGYEIIEMLRRLTDRRDYESLQAVYVYEENVDLLHLNLFVFDWTPWIESRQIYFFAGPNAANQCVDHFRNDLSKSLPDGVIPLGPQDMGQRAASAIAQATKTVLDQAMAQKNELDKLYGELPKIDLASAYFDPSQLRILLINNLRTYFVQYSIRDSRQALEKLGCVTGVLEEKDPVDKITGPEILNSLWEFQPHGVVFVDHARHESSRFFVHGLPFFAFMQDYKPEYLTNDKAKQLTPYDLFIGNMDYFVTAGFPARNLFVLPAWTNTDLYGKPRPAPDPKYRADISFVSNITTHHETAYKNLLEYYGPREPRLVSVIETVYDRALSLYKRDQMISDWVAFKDWLLSLVKQSGVRLDEFSVFAQDIYDKLINTMLRHQPLEWLVDAGYEPALWGRQWERHPTLGRFAKGIAGNGDELIDIYRASKINLHINQYRIEHPRLLDGLAAGGFFLVRHTESVGLLNISEFSFKTRDELLGQVKRFLGDSEKRKVLVQKQQDVVRQWAGFDVAYKHGFTYFGIMMLLESMAAGELNAILPEMKKLSAKTTDIVRRMFDRFFLSDPDRFVIHSAVELLETAGVLPQGSTKRLGELEKYQDKWGSMIWPRLLDQKAKQSVEAWFNEVLADQPPNVKIPAKGLLTAWSSEESNESFAYRMAQENLELPVRFSKRIDNVLVCDRLTWPDHRRAIAFRKTRANAETAEMIPEERSYFRFLRLAAKRAMYAALVEIRHLNETSRLHAKNLALAAGLAESTGRRTTAMADLDRAEQWVVEHGFEDEQTKQRLFALRLLNQMPGFITDKMRRDAEAIDLKADAYWLLKLTLARFFILENRYNQAIKALGDASTYPRGDNRAIARQFHKLLKQGAAASSTDEHPFGVFESVDVPKDGEDYHRFDRIRHVGQGRILLRTIGSSDSILVFDAADKTWLPASEKFDLPKSLGPYPAFDTADVRLFVIDPEKPELVVCDASGRRIDSKPLPNMAKYYVEDIAVHPDGHIALVDAYKGGVMLGDPRGEWKFASCEAMNPDLPIRIACLGDGYALYNNGELLRLTRNGDIAKRRPIAMAVPNLHGDENGVVCVNGYPPLIMAFDEQLNEIHKVVSLPGVINLHFAGVCGDGENLYIADDRRQELYRIKRRL